MSILGIVGVIVAMVAIVALLLIGIVIVVVFRAIGRSEAERQHMLDRFEKRRSEHDAGSGPVRERFKL